MLSHFTCVWLFATLWTITCQVPLSMGFSRTLQEYCSGLPCPPPEDLSNPGIEPTSLTSPALAGEFLTTSTTWEARILQYLLLILLIAQAYLHGDFLLFYKLKRELDISLHFLSVLKIYIGNISKSTDRECTHPFKYTLFCVVH